MKIMNSNKFLRGSQEHESNFNTNKDVYYKTKRLEIIDHTSTGEGRAYIKRGDLNIEIQEQDSGNTIKIFITDGK